MNPVINHATVQDTVDFEWKMKKIPIDTISNTFEVVYFFGDWDIFNFIFNEMVILSLLLNLNENNK